VISFTIKSVNTSERKGIPKRPVEEITCAENFGINGDCHAGPWHRQVSLLAYEDIETMRAAGANVNCGDFAENITTSGIDLAGLPIGSRLIIDTVELEITQIGKECHNGCAIRQRTGDCVMPRRGVFAIVITGGRISRESTGTYDFR
jgi:cyclic pyranopterin phosphate synthase